VTIILKWILKKYYGAVETALIWLAIGTSGRRPCRSEKPVASQEEFFCVQLAGQSVILFVGQEHITETVDTHITGSKIPRYL
jgi:hypothetical protein